MGLLERVVCGGETAWGRRREVAGRLTAEEAASENLLRRNSSDRPAALSNQKRRRRGSGEKQWRPTLGAISEDPAKQVHAPAAERRRKTTASAKIKVALAPREDEYRHLSSPTLMSMFYPSAFLF